MVTLQQVMAGGVPALTRYWRDDVTGFGYQLEDIHARLAAKKIELWVGPVTGSGDVAGAVPGLARRDLMTVGSSRSSPATVFPSYFFSFVHSAH